MKINDLNLTEAPAGMIQQAGRKLGAKALGMLPSASAKAKAAELSGKANQGAIANQMLIDFSKWIGEKGRNVSQATSADLNAYLQGRGIQSPIATPTTRVLNKNQLDATLLKVATAQIQAQQHPNASVAQNAKLGSTPGSAPLPAAKPTAPAQAVPAAAPQAQAAVKPAPAPVTQMPRVNPAKLPGATQHGTNGNWKVPTSDPQTFLVVDRSGKIVSLEKAQQASPPPAHLTDEEPRMQQAQAPAPRVAPARARAPRKAAAPAGNLVQQMKQSDM